MSGGCDKLGKLGIGGIPQHPACAARHIYQSASNQTRCNTHSKAPARV